MAVLQSQTLTTNTSTTAVTVSAKKEVFVQVFGTFGGGTLTVEMSHDGTNFTTVGTSGAFTAAGHCRVTLPVNAAIRGTLSGSAGASVTVIVSE